METREVKLLDPVISNMSQGRAIINTASPAWEIKCPNHINAKFLFLIIDADMNGKIKLKLHGNDAHYYLLVFFNDL
tara:strand:- start:404 stop:631 length:228 start_codon:yes stop_codon:yes gene_type:complete